VRFRGPTLVFASRERWILDRVEGERDPDEGSPMGRVRAAAPKTTTPTRNWRVGDVLEEPRRGEEIRRASATEERSAVTAPLPAKEGHGEPGPADAPAARSEIEADEEGGRKRTPASRKA
jgi:hypothetical protein